MVVHIYGDLMSQPTRAVVLLCRLTGIPHKVHIINLAKGDHKKAAFLAINPLGKVPVIEEDGFTLSESHAILRYLAQKWGGVADHWYPQRLQERGMIDSVLDWHHSNTRRGAAGTTWNRVICVRRGMKPNPAVLEESLGILRASLATLESFWLAKGPYLAGQDSLSIADISLASELKQLELLESSEYQELFVKCPKVRAWLAAVERDTAPHAKEVYQLFERAKQVIQKERSSATARL